MIASLNPLVTSQEVQDGTVLRVLDYETQKVAGRRYSFLHTVPCTKGVKFIGPGASFCKPVIT